MSSRYERQPRTVTLGDVDRGTRGTAVGLRPFIVNACSKLPPTSVMPPMPAVGVGARSACLAGEPPFKEVRGSRVVVHADDWAARGNRAQLWGEVGGSPANPREGLEVSSQPVDNLGWRTRASADKNCSPGGSQTAGRCAKQPMGNRRDAGWGVLALRARGHVLPGSVSASRFGCSAASQSSSTAKLSQASGRARSCSTWRRPRWCTPGAGGRQALFSWVHSLQRRDAEGHRLYLESWLWERVDNARLRRSDGRGLPLVDSPLVGRY